MAIAAFVALIALIVYASVNDWTWTAIVTPVLLALIWLPSAYPDSLGGRFAEFLLRGLDHD